MPDRQSLNGKAVALDVEEMVDNRPTPDRVSPKVTSIDLGSADVLIAAITCCTNTSNPSC